MAKKHKPDNSNPTGLGIPLPGTPKKRRRKAKPAPALLNGHWPEFAGPEKMKATVKVKGMLEALKIRDRQRRQRQLSKQ